jgi:glycoside/pentoside/hexuronide:cation symporter, GPH family
VSFGLLALLIGLPLSAGVYYFAAVLKAPALIGPFMGLSGLGLMAGVVLSDRLTRHFCKKRVMVVSSALMGVVSLGYLATMSGPPAAVFALAFISNMMLGVTAPVSQSLLADTADAIELDTGRRVVGTLFATVGFSQKIGAGLASALVGGMLSATGYLAGQAEQPADALWGIAALMGPITGVIALLIAAVLGYGYPMGRAELARLRDDLAARRAAAATPATVPAAS